MIITATTIAAINHAGNPPACSATVDGKAVVVDPVSGVLGNGATAGSGVFVGVAAAGVDVAGGSVGAGVGGMVVGGMAVGGTDVVGTGIGGAWVGDTAVAPTGVGGRVAVGSEVAVGSMVAVAGATTSVGTSVGVGAARMRRKVPLLTRRAGPGDGRSTTMYWPLDHEK